MLRSFRLENCQAGWQQIMDGGGLGNRAGAEDRDRGFVNDTIDKDGTNDVVITVSSGRSFENEK